MILRLGDYLAYLLLGACLYAALPGIGLDMAGFASRPLACPKTPTSGLLTRTYTDIEAAGEAPQITLARLCGLPVAALDESLPYLRSAFGQAWMDTDRNGCDTRNDILARDLRQVRKQAGSGECIVQAGTLLDPYTGTTIGHKRGSVTSPQIQIDHIVALGAAWRTGANRWDGATRQEFANDPLVLAAVQGQANQDKGRKQADEWLPQNPAFRCAYVARQVAIKTKWQLWITPEEKAAILTQLGKC